MQNTYNNNKKSKYLENFKGLKLVQESIICHVITYLTKCMFRIAMFTSSPHTELCAAVAGTTALLASEVAHTVRERRNVLLH